MVCYAQIIPYCGSSWETDLRLLARYSPVQQWRQNQILPQRGGKQNNENALDGLENVSLPCREGEMKGIWLPCASLPLFCSMSNVKTFLYSDILPLFQGWHMGLHWGRTELDMQQGGPAVSWTGEVRRWSHTKVVPSPASVGNGSWITCLCLKAAGICVIAEQCCSQENLICTWDQKLVLDLFCKCLPVPRWQDQHPAQSMVSPTWMQERRVLESAECFPMVNCPVGTDWQMGQEWVRPLCESCAAIWEQVRLSPPWCQAQEISRKNQKAKFTHQLLSLPSLQFVSEVAKRRNHLKIVLMFVL